MEPGSGSSEKTRLLLDAMVEAGHLRRFVPFDVSEQALREAAAAIAEEYPGIEVHGVVGDFERHLVWLPEGRRRLFAFLGSSIGNLTGEQRAGFPRLSTGCSGRRGLAARRRSRQGPARLEAAYNDSRGVTAEFNRNVLHVINRELGGDFDVERFEHVARWDAENEWIEMLLRSDVDQRVRVDALDLEVEFAAGEEMRTEISDKFRRQGLQAELDSAGVRPRPLVGGSGRRLRPLTVVLGGGTVTRVVVLGGGSAGEAFVGALSRLEGDFQMTLVERALVGGECTYWACMPSKTLLRAPELLAAARQAPGAAEAVSGTLDLERVFWWRDQVVDGYDDEGHGEWLADRDTDARPRRCDGEGSRRPRRRRTRGSRYDKLVVATGSRPALPPIDGLADAPLDDGERHGVERGSRVARRRRRRRLAASSSRSSTSGSARR